MRKLYLFVLVSLSLCLHAQTYTAPLTKQKPVNLNYTLAYDTVESIDTRWFYSLCYSTTHKGGQTHTLFYYKGDSRNFELCAHGNIDTCLVINPAFLDTEKRIDAVYIHSPDTLFALTQQHIYCFDSKGNVKQKIDYATSLNKQFKNHNIYFSQKEKPFYYSQQTGCFYISVYNTKFTGGMPEAIKKNSPIFLEYNPATTAWRDVGARHSELFRHRYYDIAIEYFSTFTGDAILYNYQAEPNIYKYTLGTGKIEAVGGASSYADSIPQGFKNEKAADREDAFSWYVRIPWYNSPMLSDPYKKLYYRLYFDAIPLKKSDGLFTGQFDKIPVLMVFDEGFNLLREIELPVGIIVGGKPFVSERGLHVDLRTASADKAKVYCIINVQ